MEICVVTKDTVLARFLLLELAESGFTAEVHETCAQGARLYLCDLDSITGELPENTIGFSYDGNKHRRVQHFLPRPIHAGDLCKAVAERMTPAVQRSDTLSLSVDRATRRVRCGSSEVRLSEKELALLERLCAVPLLTREAAIDIFGDGDSNVVDVYMHYLRKKLKSICPYDAIESKRGKGYQLGDTLQITLI